MCAAGPNPQARINAEAFHALDNPIWNSLTTLHAPIAETASLARRFPSDVTALGALAEHTKEAWDALATLPSAAKVTVLVFDAPVDPPAGWEIIQSAVGLQMVFEGRMSPGAGSSSAAVSEEIIPVTAADAPEMLALADMTRPGPFGIRTQVLGTYLGIKQKGKLIAMAGERLRLPGFTEISAVCTHPEHTGHGYATALINVLIAQIHGRGETPILHVREANTRAIELYLRLGFVRRRAFHFTGFRPITA